MSEGLLGVWVIWCPGSLYLLHHLRECLLDYGSWKAKHYISQKPLQLSSGCRVGPPIKSTHVGLSSEPWAPLAPGQLLGQSNQWCRYKSLSWELSLEFLQAS